MRMDHRIHRIATVVAFTLAGCGSISVAPPPGLDSGDGTGDPGRADMSRQDLPDGTTPDPGPDVPPLCKTHEDCKDMTGLGPCIVGRCDLDTGTCWRVMLAQGADCDDGNPCTEPDWCDNGDCVGQPRACDDHNPCTLDFCNEAGLCDVKAVDAPCSDQNACTEGDRCVQGNCVGAPVDCDDLDPCTEDSCVVSTGCVHAMKPGCKPCAGDGDCDDGNFCTEDICINNLCRSGSPLLDGTPCPPPDPCVAEAECRDGQCVPVLAMICDDGNSCTADFCFNGDCGRTPLSGSACDDNNPCTLNDSCQNGVCTGGKPVTCDDLDPCTRDYCVPPKVGCPGVPFTLGDPYQCCHVGCSEPNPTCTSIGCRCGKGTCDPVTADHCEPGLTPLEYVCKCGLGAACKPGSCCIKGQCQSGPCLIFQ